MFSRNLPELKQDLCHSEPEQGKREEQKRLDQFVIAELRKQPHLIKIQTQQAQRQEMLQVQQSEVTDLEILANQGEGGNDHQEKGRTIRSGIVKSRTIRSGKTRAATLKARSLGGSGPSGVGRMREGTLEARSLGGSPAAMSPVAVPCSNSCSVPKCNNDINLFVFLSD